VQQDSRKPEILRSPVSSVSEASSWLLALGTISADPSVNSSRILATTVAVLLVGSGVHVGQWVATAIRLSYVFSSVMLTSLAVMFGWVAIYGDAANFHGGMSIGGPALASSSAVAPARALFAVASSVTGLASLWAWKQAFRSR